MSNVRDTKWGFQLKLVQNNFSPFKKSKISKYWCWVPLHFLYWFMLSGDSLMIKSKLSKGWELFSGKLIADAVLKATNQPNWCGEESRIQKIWKSAQIAYLWDNNEMNECNGMERNILPVSWSRQPPFYRRLLIVLSTTISPGYFLTLASGFNHGFNANTQCLYVFLPDQGVPGVWSMGLGLSNSVQDLFETLLMWLWLMMIPLNTNWWCQ